MILLGLLPLLCGILLWVLLFYFSRQTGNFTRLRTSFLICTLLLGIAVAVITEVLNIFLLITVTSVLLSWVLILLLLVSYWFYRKVPFSAIQDAGTILYKGICMNWKGIVLSGIVLISFIIALVMAPNNYDSMTYHMARVVHWQQNHSINNYPTHELRQLVYQPFAEWIILHLQLLTGSDRLANSVQLFFFAGCLLNVSLIAKELGGTAQQQWLSALFAGLIPMAILQSNTTQNDIVVAYFILCFVFLTLRMLQSISRFFVLLSGIALGLSWLTKGTAYIFTFPFTLWYVVILFTKYRSSLGLFFNKALLFLLIPIIAISINSGFLYRNTRLTGNLLGNANDNTANEGFAVKPLLLVGVKNFMNHLPVTKGMKNALVYAAHKMNVDADDPKYNFITLDWMKEGFYYHEDYVQNFVHTLVILLISILFFCKRSLYRKKPDTYIFFVITLFGTTLLYCLLLKWQPWANRLQTCLFMLFCIFLGFKLSYRNGLRRLLYPAFFYFAAKSLLWNYNHPVLPFKAGLLYRPYESAIYSPFHLELRQYLNKKPYTKIGIYIGPDMWDYPYYKLLSNSGEKHRILEHVMVNNESAKYNHIFVPDAIISIDTSRTDYLFAGKKYLKTKQFSGGPALFEAP